MTRRFLAPRLPLHLLTSRSLATVVRWPFCGLLAAAATGAMAQSNSVPYGLGATPYGGTGLSIRDVAARKNNQNERSFWLTPSLGVTGTLTNNVNLTADKKKKIYDQDLLAILPNDHIQTAIAA